MSKKKKRNIELFIVDILIAIQKIKSYVSIFDNPNNSKIKHTTNRLK